MSGWTVIASGLDFPEGPSVAADGTIWVSELAAGRIARVEPGGAVRRYAVGGRPNGTAIAPDGAIWFCDATGSVRRLDPDDGAATTLADRVGGEPLAEPNDLAFAPDGSLVFSCPGDSRREPTGYLCRRGEDGRVARIAEGLRFPNGLCFHDGRLFVAETYACRVVAGAWGSSPALATVMETDGPIGADGVAVSDDGTIHACVYGNGTVRTARAGTVRDIEVPDAHPAGCAIDPLYRWDLIVTGTATGVLLGMTA